MTGFRELPPLRVKLVGDNTSYKKMADESKAIAEDLAKSVNATAKKTKAGPSEAEFLRVFHNYRLLEKSKEIQASLSRKAAKIEEARLFQNEQLLEKMRAVEEAKGKAAKRAAEKALRAEETRLFQNQVLLEKIRQLELARGRAAQRAAEKALVADENRLFRNELLLEKIRQLENKRANAAKRAAEKALAAEEQRIFQNELLLEKIRQKELAIGRAAEKAAARAIKAEEDRIFQNEALLDKIRQKEVAKGRAAVRAAEKALAAEEARLFQNEALLEKIRRLEVKRGNAAARAAEKAKKAEEDRLFSNLQLLEKINALEAKRKGAAAQREEDRIFQNEALLEKIRQSEAQKQKTADDRRVREHARLAREEQRMRAAGGDKIASLGQAITQAAYQADQLVTKATSKQLADAKRAANTKAAEEKRRIKEMEKGLDAYWRKEKQMLREKDRMERAMERARERAQNSRRSRGGAGYDSFGGLGDRADIYMHANAIRTLVDASQSFVAASANWERMQVMMTGFTGSSTEAARVMEDMRLAALESPYDMQTLMDATKQMMGYGASADTAVEVTKMLGDVAGGSNDKMSRLALGMAQITSMGKLQGNELRQLTEHGFNPLRVIAEETGIAYATLNKAKEEGLITDKMVVAALKVVTSEGGRFANMSYRMSNDVWGLAQRIKELATQLQRRFMDTLIAETKAALRVVIDFVTALDKWAAAAENQQMVQSLARMARDAMVAAVAFHVLAGGIAVARWGMRQFISVFLLFSKSIGVVTASVKGLFALLTGAGLASNPVGWILGAVAALTAAVVALDVGLSREGGFAKFFKDMDEFGKRAFTFMQGFMANLGENMDILFKYLKENWNQVLMAMGKAWLRITMSVIDFIVIQMPRELGPMFVDIGWSLYASLTNAYRRAIKFYVLTWDAYVNKNPVALGELAAMATDLATAIAPGAKEARDKFRADRRTQAQKGLLDTIGTILSDEFGNLPNIPFNLKTPPVPGEPPMPAAPPKPDIDWGSMFNESIGKQGSKAVRPVAAGAAPIYRSAEYAVRVQAARDAMQARRRGDANMETDVEKRMLQELKKISKNTGAKPAPVQINSANFLGQEVA